MKVLGIETATLVCAAALVDDGRILGEEHTVERNVHAENIMRLIDSVMQRTGIAPDAVDAIAVSAGPGSFTGLRIGFSVAKGLCFALDKPLVAVPTLEALARRAVDAGLVGTEFLLPALDARRDEVYCRLFRLAGNGLQAEWSERDMTVDNLARALAGRSVSVTGDGTVKIRSSGRLAHAAYISEPYSLCSAASVALTGWEMALRGMFALVATAEPIYVKEFYTTHSH